LDDDSFLNESILKNGQEEVVNEVYMRYADQLKLRESNDSNKLYAAKGNIVITKSNGLSFLKPPLSDLNSTKIWIKKKGHLTGNWKDRFCIIDKETLKFYVKELNSKLHGELSFLGTYCNITQGGSNLLHLELTTSQRTRDLIFEINNFNTDTSEVI
jgi:hypothetical protein